MRILQIATLFTPDGAYGGPTRVALNQAAALKSKGHQVVIAGGCLDYDEVPRESDDGVDLQLFEARRLVPRTGFAGLASPRLNRWLRRHLDEFDVVHIHLARDLVTLPATLLSQARLPTLVQTHGMIDASSNVLANLFDPVLTRRALRKAHTVFFLTERERTDLRQAGVSEAQLQLLINGVPPNEFQSVRRRDVVFVARLHPRKMATQFVRSAMQLAPRHPNWTFTLIGKDEGEAALVNQLIAASGITDRIKYIGPIAPHLVAERLSKSSIFALPSRHEPFPMSALEALAAGLPAIVSDTCGLARDIAEAKAGFVVDGSQESLVTAIDRLISDSKLLSAMSFNALQLTAERYSLETVADRLVQSYEKAVARV